MTRRSKKDIVRVIENTMALNHDGDTHNACLYWAFYTVEVLKVMFGVRAIIQAGTAAWPRLRPDQDDGTPETHSHLTYQWEPDSQQTKERLAADLMPEVHVWAAIPDRGEIIDLTTRFWPEQCQRTTGLDWPGDKPPAFFWGTDADLPYGVIYRPDMSAIEWALARLNAK